MKNIVAVLILMSVLVAIAGTCQANFLTDAWREIKQDVKETKDNAKQSVKEFTKFLFCLFSTIVVGWVLAFLFDHELRVQIKIVLVVCAVSSLVQFLFA